jgi:hypothetical protein
MKTEVVAWTLFIAGFVAYYVPRLLISQKLELSSEQVVAQRPDLAQVVKLFPLISLGYLVLTGAMCISLIFLLNLSPYPEGLVCLSIFWGGLGMGDSIFALSTKLMSISNRLQFRYAIVVDTKITLLLYFQLVLSTVIVILSIGYLVMSNFAR